MSRFDTIDLSRVPTPDAINAPDYETILSERMADLGERFAAAGIPFDVARLDSDPVSMLQQEDAWRELLQFAAINDAVRAVLLPSSWGSNLDALGAMFSVARAIIDAGDASSMPPVPPVMESDDRYRRRIQLAPEAFATTGSRGSYAFHALSAHVGVLDVAVLNHASGILQPGEVAVVILPATVEQTSSIVEAVRDRLMRDDVKPLTDALEIRIAQPIVTNITATLRIKRGPDAQVIKSAAQLRLTEYLSRQRRVGETVALSGIYGALQADNVERVVLSEPVTDIEPGIDEVVTIGTVTLLTRYIDE